MTFVGERFVDPVLIALSDALVLTALERAWSRTVPRSKRAGVRSEDRHRGYMRVPIAFDRLDKALEDAWLHCPQLATRNHLDVDSLEWVGLLDGYTRALIIMGQDHTTQRLLPYLAELSPAKMQRRAYIPVTV